ncbi:unnamed protein product [Durusdinium trenchii]|uniref:Uncharacterized protein n=1 Tax=Durusdinium trenchii TaxID=1381693 RepID=A0ABP0Q2Y1_9DINO
MGKQGKRKLKGDAGDTKIQRRLSKRRRATKKGNPSDDEGLGDARSSDKATKDEIAFFFLS